MATDRSYRAVMVKSCDHSNSFIFDWFFFFHAVNKDTYKILDGFGIWQAPTENLFVLERLKKNPIDV